MNKFISVTACLISSLFFSGLTLADDTEIYGSAEIDENERINSNVLFIMDTSGSMSGSVGITLIPYDPSATYSGSYTLTDVYNSINDSSWRGHNATALTSSYSEDCSGNVITLATVGKVLDTYKQYRNGAWRSLSDGNDGVIRCDQGSSKWLYSGNYMNWYHDTTNVTASTRMEVVVDVVKELTNSLSDINLGLMRFDQSSDGGMIDVPVTPITTSGAQIRAKLDAYYPQGGTPLEETLYESARYYRGNSWMFGNNSTPNVSVSASRESAISADYKSPIEATCQKNHVILLTDGQPTSDQAANDDVRAHISSMSLPSGLNPACSGNGDCLDELAYWMKNTDHSGGYVGNQDITTYTIGGFDLADGVELLKRTANWGGGRYYEANDTAGLTDALDSIFLDILATDSTFTAPAVSVNAFNASEHRDDLFYALFRPADNVKWGGNLKKYRLTSEGIVVGNGSESPAISETTGFFNDGVFDYWNDSGVPDGKNVALGGTANKMQNPASRKVYTEDSASFLGSYTAFATQESFGMTDDTAADFVNVRQWSIGLDVDDQNGDGSITDSRKSIGDPLHSEPVIITYGGTDDAPDSTIYFGTNEGFIHAIDTETGQEEFAFIPKTLHATQKTYYENTAAAGDKPYGMDGHISTWFYDKNSNNILLNADGSVESDEHVYLYAGMRRGGNNYYALDVTDRNSPTMQFKIEGGTGDFAKLGQTWSRMTVAKVKLAGQTRFVLFFAGGYDTNQDGNDTAEVDAIGNAIYMVDAATGQRLWWSSNTGANLNIDDMVNSIPASLSVVDITGDGFTDYLFAADTGGRVFRIDLNQVNSGAGDFAKGGMIASLAGTDEANNRRFYNKPNVALIKDKQYGDYLTIAIGSGHRAHPIYTEDVENRFYMIKDFSPYHLPPGTDTTRYKVKTEAATDKTTLTGSENADPLKLYNATSLMTDGRQSPAESLEILMNNGGGWYVTFETKGEKVLAESTTFSGAIIFTTFSPTGGSSTENCGPDTGASRIYALDQKWATATIDLDGDGDLDSDDASKILAHSGIAPRPVVIYRKGGGKTIAIGTETIDDDRFEQQASDETCTDDGTCEQQVKKCESNNCSVTPIYWRQNDEH